MLSCTTALVTRADPLRVTLVGPEGKSGEESSTGLARFKGLDVSGDKDNCEEQPSVFSSTRSCSSFCFLASSGLFGN